MKKKLITNMNSIKSDRTTMQDNLNNVRGEIKTKPEMANIQKIIEARKNFIF
jgi:hypothetical protein